LRAAFAALLTALCLPLTGGAAPDSPAGVETPNAEIQRLFIQKLAPQSSSPVTIVSSKFTKLAEVRKLLVPGCAPWLPDLEPVTAANVTGDWKSGGFAAPEGRLAVTYSRINESHFLEQFESKKA